MNNSPEPEPVSSRPRTYLIAKDATIAAPSTTGPAELDFLLEQMQSDPNVIVERQLSPRSFSAQVLGTSITDLVVVASMPDSIANELAQHPQLIIEEDHLVRPQLTAADLLASDPGILIPFGETTAWTIKLIGAHNQPVTGATVYLYGSGVPAQGRTDDQGMVTLGLVNESDATLRALYINPLSDYWSIWLNRPTLVSGGAVNTVPLQPLADYFSGFPDTQMLGWGQRAMRLDRLPRTMTGRGVRVAVVDSGAAALTHSDLAQVHSGVDLTTAPENSDHWTDDTIAHGSHCSGIIAGADDAHGIRGFAPAAEVHEARIFPGGRVSSLIDAVDYCIDHNIDVVNMSLGTGGSSQILLQKIAQAKEQGVACIVAAGNSGGPVQFPGTSPDVLTVAAIGQEGQFPENSYHAQQRWTKGSVDHDYFSAQFSCHGPEVDVCGPGVAVVSSVPPDGFAAWDGTSMATPHVTGLAALVLAHHPDFQTGPLQLRNAARVDRLFQILRSSATALEFGDPTRSAFGLPDAVRALGLDTTGALGDASASKSEAVGIALAQLRQELIAVGLVSEPANAAPQPFPMSPIAIKRDLAEVQAQILAAGLLTDGVPAI